MEPDQIRGLLLTKGYRSKDVAREVSVSRTAIDRVIAGSLTSTRIMKHIAEVLGRSPIRVFPAKAHLFKGA